MKNTKLVAAAAIVAMGGAVALTAHGRSDDASAITGLTVGSVLDDATRQGVHCTLLSVGELDKFGCVTPE